MRQAGPPPRRLAGWRNARSITLQLRTLPPFQRGQKFDRSRVYAGITRSAGEGHEATTRRLCISGAPLKLDGPCDIPIGNWTAKDSLSSRFAPKRKEHHQCSRAVCVWPRHVELSHLLPEHRIHGEPDGGDVQRGDGVGSAMAERRSVGRAMAERRSVGRVDLQPVRDCGDAPRRRTLPGFSRRVATDAAAVPGCDCSTASAVG